MDGMLAAIAVAGGVMAGLGLLTSGGLLIAARRFYVFEDPRIGQIEELLPGANCGACGLPGCKAYSEALVLQGSEGTCPAASSEVLAQIGEILGKQITGGTPMKAVVMCAGTNEVAKRLGIYEGLHDCRAAHLLGAAEKICPYGCIGIGTCIEFCPFDAIVQGDGTVFVDAVKCTGCGNCLDACPRDLFELIPAGHQVYVACASHDSAKKVRSYCSVGCVSCQACIHKVVKEKVRGCPEDAIEYIDGLAHIDHDKCTQCWECVEMCRTKTILHVGEELPAVRGETQVEVA